MKKIALSLVLVMLVTAIFSVTVLAAEGDEYVITFASAEEYPDILHVDSMDVAVEEEVLKLTFTGATHPLFWFGLGASGTKNETPLNASEYKYMKIRYNSEAEDDVLRLFYATYTDLENNPGPAFTGENMIDLDINHGAGWQSLIFDMGSIENWKDYISALRFDIDPIMDGAGLTADSEGAVFSVSYIAFFKTEADAKAYKADLDPAEEDTTEPVIDSEKDTADDTANDTKPVDSKDDTTDKISEKVTDTAPSTEKPKEKSDNTGVIIGIVAAAVVVAAVVVFLVVKNKKSK